MGLPLTYVEPFSHVCGDKAEGVHHSVRCGCLRLGIVGVAAWHEAVVHVQEVDALRSGVAALVRFEPSTADVVVLGIALR